MAENALLCSAVDVLLVSYKQANNINYCTVVTAVRRVGLYESDDDDKVVAKCPKEVIKVEEFRNNYRQSLTSSVSSPNFALAPLFLQMAMKAKDERLAMMLKAMGGSSLLFNGMHKQCNFSIDDIDNGQCTTCETLEEDIAATSGSVVFAFAIVTLVFLRIVFLTEGEDTRRYY